MAADEQGNNLETVNNIVRLYRIQALLPPEYPRMTPVEQELTLMQAYANSTTELVVGEFEMLRKKYEVLPEEDRERMMRFIDRPETRQEFFEGLVASFPKAPRLDLMTSEQMASLLAIEYAFASLVESLSQAILVQRLTKVDEDTEVRRLIDIRDDPRTDDLTRCAVFVQIWQRRLEIVKAG